ncbi:MAG: flippase-like domain-containing protein [Bifidobacteriaceae bacterium]|nr:flippase-like domain-containing protein [Bifidobacteriaceae bacterium]
MRKIVSAISLIAVVIIVYLARYQLLEAFYLFWRVNIWWLICLLPLQLLVYYSMSETGISYLEQNRQIKPISWWTKIKIALELNFVNHILPSGGASGIGYGIWRLKTVGVEKTHSTLAQMIRLVAGYVAYVPVLIICVILSIVSESNHYILETIATIIVVFSLVGLIWLGFMLTKRDRLTIMATNIVRFVNLFIRHITFKKVNQAISEIKWIKTLEIFADDYNKLFSEKQLLLKPLMWGLFWIMGDTLMFEITFLALGQPIDLTAIFLAYGFAGVSGFVFMTPGGAGAYETAFVFILVWCGIQAPLATTGVILTRTILMFCTLATGAYFYHKALRKA